MAKDKQKFNLAEIIDVLNYPLKTGFADKMQLRVFSQEEAADIWHSVWPKIMTKKEWDTMSSRIKE